MSMTLINPNAKQWCMEAIYSDGTLMRLGSAGSKEEVLQCLDDRLKFESAPGYDQPKAFDKDKLEYIRVFQCEDRYVPTEWWEEGE